MLVPRFPILRSTLPFLACLWLACNAPPAQPTPVPAPIKPVLAAPARARNLILFLGDGMGLSTIAAARAMHVGVDGELAMDKLPFTALSRTADADHITADSASTMTAIMTGVSVSSGVVGLSPETERADFNHDGDGAALTTLLELALSAGMRVGVVTTARITHATPASCYAHVNDRDKEDDIATQLVRGANYNARLGAGVDLLFGGGRRHFLPKEVTDEEGELGKRSDGRDLRQELIAQGYHYVWNADQLAALPVGMLPVLGLFDSSHMEYEIDRKADVGGEPSLSAMTLAAIERLSAASRAQARGYLLIVEGGRIDHAHHDGNAARALTETVAFDDAIAAARARVDLRDTLLLATADHSHTFSLVGYPMRPGNELKYAVKSAPEGFAESAHRHVLGVVHDIDREGNVSVTKDDNGVPYTAVGYLNGPGHRDSKRVDPRADRAPGFAGKVPSDCDDPAYLQQSLVPLEQETHGGEDVPLFAVGAGAQVVHGTMRNTGIFTLMRDSLGL